jgi:hypothetical protein
MSFAQLRETVAGLSAKERFELSALLADLEQENESEFRAVVDRRVKAMDGGAKMTMEELERRHQELEAERR